MRVVVERHDRWATGWRASGAGAWRVPAILALTALAPLTAAMAAPCAADSRAGRLLRRGDEVFARSFTAAPAWQAVALYAQALEAAPDCFTAAWRLARGYAWIGEMNQDRGGDPALGKKGYDAAFRAIQLGPRRVEGYYWAALTVGEHGKGLGVLRALQQGIGGKFRRYLDEALRLDPAYDDGGPNRVYGFYFNAIPWPLRDNKKALDNLRRSLRYSPRHPRTLYVLARILVVEGHRAEAAGHLKRCVALRENDGSPRINRHYLWRCRELLRQVGAATP